MRLRKSKHWFVVWQLNGHGMIISLKRNTIIKICVVLPLTRELHNIIRLRLRGHKL